MNKLPDTLVHRESGVRIPCSVVKKTRNVVNAQLAPNTTHNSFTLSEWEIIPAFEFPTRTGAQIKLVREEGVDDFSGFDRFTLDNESPRAGREGPSWYNTSAGRYKEKDLRDYKGTWVVTYPGDPEA